MDNEALGALGVLLSNPEAISKIGSVISKYTTSENRDISPQTDIFEGNHKDYFDVSNNKSTNPEVATPTLQNQEGGESASVSNTKKKESRANENDQITLLLAIRPYLSDKRKEMIDTFVRLSKMGHIFKNLL